MVNLPDLKLIEQTKQGNEVAFEHLLMRYEALISKIARKYYLQSYEFEDFYQIGAIAFYRAVQTYEEQEEVTFYSYSLSCVRNALVSIYRREASKNEYTFEHEEIMLMMESRADYVVDDFYTINKCESPFQYYRSELAKLLLRDDFFGKVEKYCVNGFIKGMTYEEIAVAIDLDIEKIWSAMTRVRRKLKNYNLD